MFSCGFECGLQAVGVFQHLLLVHGQHVSIRGSDSGWDSGEKHDVCAVVADNAVGTCVPSGASKTFCIEFFFAHIEHDEVCFGGFPGFLLWV